MTDSSGWVGRWGSCNIGCTPSFMWNRSGMRQMVSLLLSVAKSFVPRVVVAVLPGAVRAVMFKTRTL